MTMLAEVVELVIGVDTHKDTHTAAVVTATTGAVLAQATVAATPAGYRQLLALADRHDGRRCGRSRHRRLRRRPDPGLYFVGLSFLYAMSSGFLPGVDRDAEHIVHAILAGADRTSDRPGPAVDHGIRRPMRSG